MEKRVDYDLWSMLSIPEHEKDCLHHKCRVVCSFVPVLGKDSGNRVPRQVICDKVVRQFAPSTNEKKQHKTNEQQNPIDDAEKWLDLNHRFCVKFDWDALVHFIIVLLHDVFRARFLNVVPVGSRIFKKMVHEKNAMSPDCSHSQESQKWVITFLFWHSRLENFFE